MLFYRFDSTTGTLLEFTEHDIITSKEIYRSYSEITLLTEFVDTMPEDVQERYEAAIVQYMNLMKEKGK
jgi:predicted phosphoadenosine phosphosulfate sulfurtransferase